MALSRDELLKPIWHAFTALDVDRSGKVSKSQLKVLSHNLCTVLNVPHDPAALEEHFKDDDEGPVSNQGYMPYLSTYILDKMRGEYEKVDFYHMCWTLCCKKKLEHRKLQISEEDAFRLWCIFNFLSEDRYPLVLVNQEMEYLLRKLCEAMGGSWVEQGLDQTWTKSGSDLSVWDLLGIMGAGLFKNIHRHTLSMGINEVFQELILDVLKQGFLLKKGHKRKNWTERWFVLRPHCVSYFTGENQETKKGDILLDGSCFVESLPDKEGKKCLFLMKSSQKSFEISASDKKKKQEWIQALQMVVSLLRQQRAAPHREARERRREQRRKLQEEQRDLEQKMSELQTSNEEKQRELEEVRKALLAAAENAAEEERRRLQTQTELQERFKSELDREKLVRAQAEQQMLQKSSELEVYLQRVKELELMYQQLEGALEEERRARGEEEAVRTLQSRLLEEESLKRAELEQIHLNQKRALSETEAENQELQKERAAKEAELQEAMTQLDQLETERRGALQQYETVMKKLENATNKTKNWKHKVEEHEGLLRLIQPGQKGALMVTNWGPAAVSEAELLHREKEWQGKKSQN